MVKRTGSEMMCWLSLDVIYLYRGDKDIGHCQGRQIYRCFHVTQKIETVLSLRRGVVMYCELRGCFLVTVAE